MIPNLPIYVSVVFILTTLLTLFLFYWTMKNSPISNSSQNFALGGMIFWLLLQMGISWSGFYNQNMDQLPPRIFLTFGPTIFLMIGLFLSPKGKKFIDNLSLKHLTWVNIVRIPVEICLYWLALNKVIPELMSFAGRNFDIIAGITAPIMVYFCFAGEKIKRVPLLVWNVAMLGLLLFIVFNGILSAPLPFQQFAFDQPNIALGYFPFAWLPGFIVPVVLFGHFVSIRRLLKA